MVVVSVRAWRRSRRFGSRRCRQRPSSSMRRRPSRRRSSCSTTPASEGADLVVFPECFVSIYPTGLWAAEAAKWSSEAEDLWARMWASSVDVGGPLVGELAAACADVGVHVAIGVNEREDERPGSLYNSLLYIGPEGLLHRHRKLMPTMHERVFHGVGAGDDLDVVSMPGVGRVGGLICWENRMPLARWQVYLGGPQIWVAPTADDSDGWIASVRHIAIEATAFVVSVPQFIPREAYPGGLPDRAARGHRRLRAWRCVHRLTPRRGDRRAALRGGGHRRRGLRPGRRCPGEALLRRVRPLLAGPTCSTGPQTDRRRSDLRLR